MAETSGFSYSCHLNRYRRMQTLEGWTATSIVASFFYTLIRVQ